MADYFVIDTRTNEIVNCIESRTRKRADECRRTMVDSEHLRIDDNPPREMLERYEFWNERP